MKRHCFVILMIFLLFTVLGLSCSDNPVKATIDTDTPSESEIQEPTSSYGREFWGYWMKMDQSERWMINSTSIKVNDQPLSREVVLIKSSENVITVSDNENTYCLYAVRTATSSVSGSVASIGNARALSGGYASVVLQNINDANDKIETIADANGCFTANNIIVGENYNVTIGNMSLDVKPAFDGEDIGTITVKEGVNFKVSLFNDYSEMYVGPRSEYDEYYDITLKITNVGDENCSAATFSLIGDDGLEVVNNYSDGVLLRTVAVGETKRLPIRVKCDSFDGADYKVKKIHLAITDRNGTTWNDSVSLKFYRESAKINITSEDNRPISGVIIGGGKTFSISNNTSYQVTVPVIDRDYLLVFSGAIANVSRNTETAYSIGINCNATHPDNLLAELGTETNKHEPNDDEQSSWLLENNRCYVSFLFDGDVDYYRLGFLHSWEREIVSRPTCMEKGLVRYSCSHCGEVVNEELKLSHVWDAGIEIVPATRTTIGRKQYTCQLCGQQKTVNSYYEFSIGDTGPAGGYIIYDCDLDNSEGNPDNLESEECGWRFIEAACSDIRYKDSNKNSVTINGGYGDGLFVPGVFTASNPKGRFEVVSVPTYNGIGYGKTNTERLCHPSSVNSLRGYSYFEVCSVRTNDAVGYGGRTSYYAARVCDILESEYETIVYDDWCLPSIDELVIMFNCIGRVGGFVKSESVHYCSSSYYKIFNFETGSERNGGGIIGYRVRPIRYF